MDILGVGPLELVVILLILLVFFGPDRLPEMGNKLGRALRDMRSATREFSREIDSARAALEAPINEIRQPLQEMAEPFKEIKDSAAAVTKAAQTVRDPSKAIRDSVMDAMKGPGEEAEMSTGEAKPEAPQPAGAVPAAESSVNNGDTVGSEQPGAVLDSSVDDGDAAGSGGPAASPASPGNQGGPSVAEEAALAGSLEPKPPAPKAKKTRKRKVAPSEGTLEQAATPQTPHPDELDPTPASPQS